MNREIPLEELRKRSIFIGMPCYGGQMSGVTGRSLADLAAVCTHYQIKLKIHMLFNESLITRARSYIADEFMRSDCTNLMFIDSDIGFQANDVISLLALQSEESEFDVIGAGYPKKTISWEKIKMAVDKGFADEDPNNLEKFVGDYVFNPKAGTERIAIGEPCEVSELGTGFMMIKRSTFERYKEAYPNLLYRPDHIRTEHFDGSREIMLYFDCIIDPETKRYLSEDYNFCYHVQKFGGKVWLCPWMSLVHYGTMAFGGSLADLASIGAPATAQPEMLKKNKKDKR